MSALLLKFVINFVVYIVCFYIGYSVIRYFQRRADLKRFQSRVRSKVLFISLESARRRYNMHADDINTTVFTDVDGNPRDFPKG